MKKIAILLLIVLHYYASAESLMLISAEEMNASNNAPVRFTPKVAPDKDAPIIEILNPKMNGSIQSPTQIELKFGASPASTVKPETFKVLYGTFQLDITKRILSVAKVTEEGVNVKEAKLPPGKHKLILNIEDSMGRVGTQIVEFEVK